MQEGIPKPLLLQIITAIMLGKCLATWHLPCQDLRRGHSGGGLQQTAPLDHLEYRTSTRGDIKSDTVFIFIFILFYFFPFSFWEGFWYLAMSMLPVKESSVRLAGTVMLGLKVNTEAFLRQAEARNKP